jgi:Zn-dependent peptidase ImmA (M78 family)
LHRARHAPGDEQRQVDAETRRRVRQARRLQHGISWALRANDDVGVPRAGLDASPEVTAAAVRSWLEVAADAPRNWADPHAAFDGWRSAFEGRGVLVFTPQLGADNVRGFSAWDDKAPLVAANVSGYPYEARVFTLAHELGHLVTRIDSACVDLGIGTSVPVERWCEEFGAALLMPLDVMRELQRERRIGRQEASIDDVRAVAARCKVSHRAAALRLIDLDLARRDLYATVLSLFRPRARPTTPRPDFRQPRRSTARIREYGAHTLELALSELPPRDAMSMLRVNVEDVREIAEKVPGVPGF